ncbi:MAG: hypothetical protein JKY97_11060, partial [Citromicrobium sp.]|nr:hypothetical protein [Citromicrobium sp.]
MFEGLQQADLGPLWLSFKLAAATLALLLLLGASRIRTATVATAGTVLAALAAIGLAALVAWALVSWFWSITPGETLKTGLALSATFLGGTVLFAAGAALGAGEKKVFQNGIILGG